MTKKIKIILLLASLGLPILSVVAQDGSSAGAVITTDPTAVTSVASAPTSTEVATATPRATGSSVPVGAIPRGVTSTSTPVSPTLSNTVTAEETTVEPLPRPQENGGGTASGFSPSTLELLALAGGAVLVLYGGYALQTKNKTKNKGDEKKDKSRCFDIKKLMDEKLGEITDLKGQLEDKTKDMAREKIREMVKETVFAEMLATIESGEKEYNRLKQLFNKCMIDFENDKLLKKLKFRHEFVKEILEGKKTTTWRLFDDKNLQVGDELELINAKDGNTFGNAKITNVIENAIRDLTDEEFKKHEYESRDKMIERHKEYYGSKVNLDTIVKIIQFKIL